MDYFSFFSALIGGLIPLIAVVLTNEAHSRRLEEQFEHDRTLKKDEREMSLRKEVYLDAAEAVSAGLIAINRFSNLETAHDKLIDDYIAKVPSLQKTHVVAKEETAIAVTIFSGELNATFLRLFSKRAPLVRQFHEIALLRSQVENFMKEQAEILQLIKQYNMDGSTDRQRWDFLQSSFEYARTQAVEISKKADGLGTTLYSLQLKFMEECAEEAVRLARVLVPLIISVRKELDLPIEEVGYSRLLEQGVAMQTNALKQFSEEIKAQWSDEAES